MLRAVSTPGPEQTCVCAPELDNVVMRLDGGGACLRVEDTGVDTPAGNQITLEGWVRVNEGATGSQTILYLPLEHQPLLLRLHGRAWEFGQTPPRARLRARARNTDRWLHLAGVCEPNALKLYLGGRLAAAARTRCVIKLIPGALIGAAAHERTGAPDQFFDGALARLRVWSKALSASELQQAARTPRPTGADLLADWPLNEGCGELACNRSLDTKDRRARSCLGNALFQVRDSRPQYIIENIG